MNNNYQLEINNLRMQLNDEKVKNNNLNNAITNLNNTINYLNQQINVLRNENNNLKLQISNNQFNNNFNNQFNNFNNYNLNNNNSGMHNYIISNQPGEKIFDINFVSMGNQLIQNYNIVCRNTDLFVYLEEKLYNAFPDFKNYETYFQNGAKRILRFKTIEENGIKSNDVISVYRIE